VVDVGLLSLVVIDLSVLGVDLDPGLVQTNLGRLGVAANGEHNRVKDVRVRGAIVVPAKTIEVSLVRGARVYS
jgi:hypothetical protein